MKSARIDRLGRIVIPIDYRRKLGLEAGSEINITYDDEKVIITSPEQRCRLCKNKSIFSSEVPLCPECIGKIKSII